MPLTLLILRQEHHARRLARAIGYTYVDSGAMYRAVTLYALRHNLLPDHMDTLSAALASGCVNITFGSVSEGDGVAPTLLNAENVEQAIRTPRVSASVSLVAAQPFVRQALTTQQQAMGQGGGVVMDGRDIGTTVFPKAQLKVFVTARPEVRARRRWLELQARGDQTALESVLNNVMERDRLMPPALSVPCVRPRMLSCWTILTLRPMSSTPGSWHAIAVCAPKLRLMKQSKPHLPFFVEYPFFYTIAYDANRNRQPFGFLFWRNHRHSPRGAEFGDG